MAQSELLSCMLGNHENLHSEPQHPSQVEQHGSVTLAPGRCSRDRNGPGARGPASLAKLGSFGVNPETLSKVEIGRRRQLALTSAFHLYAHMYVYT